MQKLQDLLFRNKALFLALDQGLEHGPKDFNLQTIDSNNILELALKGGFNAIILQKGLAEKYYENYRYKVPLILKLNGKTSLGEKVEPYSPQICSVSRAIKLGASAVGYTIYFGSGNESFMFKEFAKIEEEARDHGLPIVLWAYPRGNGVDEMNTDTIAYAARAALELGADIIKLKYNGDKGGFRWIIKSAGKARVVVAGGEKTNPETLLQEVYEVMKAGATGIAIGRNVWQSENPFGVTQALKEIIFENKTPEKAIRLVKNGI